MGGGSGGPSPIVESDSSCTVAESDCSVPRGSSNRIGCAGGPANERINDYVYYKFTRNSHRIYVLYEGRSHKLHILTRYNAKRAGVRSLWKRNGERSLLICNNFGVRSSVFMFFSTIILNYSYCTDQIEIHHIS